MKTKKGRNSSKILRKPSHRKRKNKKNQKRSTKTVGKQGLRWQQIHVISIFTFKVNGLNVPNKEWQAA